MNRDEWREIGWWVSWWLEVMVAGFAIAFILLQPPTVAYRPSESRTVTTYCEASYSWQPSSQASAPPR